ncbi:uncharacterized protein LOC118454209 [Neolamprologus brichardi]|uniref:uncharacterized protein LOC118454209 n=1 Tax=Neolamprologus brichardi TaxID=32507 RepID=UPI00164385FE|nr:uncharacterized protein LOC118454209 [Neolamprologus brichardi]
MDTNDSSLNSTSTLTQLPLNTTAFINSTVKSFSVFDGCENLIEAIFFDLAMQCINVIVGIPANLLVIAILIHNRKEPSTSDIFLGCLAFMDAYFGAMTPLSFLNLYLWKDAMHPMKKKAFKMVLSILCIIVFNYLPLVALFPFEDYYSPHVFRCYVQPTGFAFLNISSTIQPLVYLSRLEKVPFLSDACIKKITSCFNPEKNQNPQEQNPPA